MGMGPAPLPWNVFVPPPTMYTNRVHKQEVPNTASVKVCILVELPVGILTVAWVKTH